MASETRPNTPEGPLPQWMFWTSHIGILLIGGGVIFLHLKYYVPISWELLTLLVVTLLPLLLPLFGCYVSELQWAKLRRPYAYASILVATEPNPTGEKESGAQKPIESVSPPASEPKKFRIIRKVPSAAVRFPLAAITIDSYGPAAKKVLRTLWTHQRKMGLSTPDQRWGFRIDEQSRAYPEYADGVRSLRERGMVEVGDNDLVYLSEPGIKFCDAYNEVLTDGPVWDNFSPA